MFICIFILAVSDDGTFPFSKQSDDEDLTLL